MPRYVADYENVDAGIGHALGYFNSLVKVSQRSGLELLYSPAQVRKSTNRSKRWRLKQLIKSLVGRHPAESHNIGDSIDTLFDFASVATPRESIERRRWIGRFKRLTLPNLEIPPTGTPQDDARVYADIDRFIRAHPQDNVLFVLPKKRTGDCEYGPTRTWFRECYSRARAKRPIERVYAPGRTSVAVHIRRGDLLPGRQFSHLADRMLPDAWYLGLLQRLQALCQRPLDIHVFSEGRNGQYQDERGQARHWREYLPDAAFVREHIDGPFAFDFHQMLTADILIGSRSGMSHLSAMLGDGLKLVPPMWHSYDGGRDVVVVDPVTGAFDEAMVGAALHAQGQRRASSG